jgi:O-antigen/teichoic acid export membrane protein
MKKTTLLIKDTFLVLVAEYFYYGVLFFIGALVSRLGGESEFGNYNLIFTVAQICIQTLGSCFSILLRKEIAIDNTVGNAFLNKIINLRIIVLITSVILGTCFIFFVYKASIYLVISFIFIALYRGFDLLNDSFFIYYQAYKNFKKYFIIKIGTSFLLIFIFFFVVNSFQKKIDNGYIVLASISLLVFLAQLFFFKKNKIDIQQSKKITYKYILSQSWPIILNSFFFQVNSRLSILLIGYLCINPGDLGLYSAAISIISAIAMVGNGLAIVFFSNLTAYYNSNIKKFQSLLFKICAGLLLAGIIFSILFTVFTPIFLDFYKITNDKASQVFFWCGIAIPLIMVNTILGYIFIIINRQKLATLISVIVLFTTIIITYFLTNTANIVGASQAYFITTTLNFIILVFALKFSNYQVKNFA